MTMKMGILAICIHLLLLTGCESTPASRKLNNRGPWRKLQEENADKLEEAKVEIQAKSDEIKKAEVTEGMKEEPIVADALGEETKIEPVVQKEEEGTETGSKEEPSKDETVKEEAKVEAIGEVSKEETAAQITKDGIETEMVTEKMDTAEIGQEQGIKETNAQAQEVIKEGEATSGTSDPQSKSFDEGRKKEEEPVERVQAQREQEKPQESVEAQKEEEKPIESVEIQKEEEEKPIESVEAQKEEEKPIESVEIQKEEEEKPIESEEVQKEEEKPLEISAEVQKKEERTVEGGEDQKEEEKPSHENVEVRKEEEKPSDEITEAEKEDKSGESVQVQKDAEEKPEHMQVQTEEEKRDERMEVQSEDGKPEGTSREHKQEERPVEESSVETAVTEEKQQHATSFEQTSEDVEKETSSMSTGVTEEEKRENAEEQIKESPSGGLEEEHAAEKGSNEGEKQDNAWEENPIKMVQSGEWRGEEKQASDGAMERKDGQEEQTMQSSAGGEKGNTADDEDKHESSVDDSAELKENESDSSVTDQEASQVRLDEETQAATKEVETQLELLKRDTVLDTMSDQRQERDHSDDDYDIIQELAELPTKFQETAGKVADHLRPDVQRWTDTSKVYFNLANQQITDSFSPLIGRQYAPFFASMISYGMLLIPLVVVIILFEHIKALLSLQKVLLFINIYLAAYFTTLWLASIIGLEPMSFFYQNNLSSYLSLQLLQAFGYVVYLILEMINIMFACSSDMWAGKLTAVLQWVVSMAIGLHYYVTVFHPAVASKPPHTSWKFYAIYSVAFFVLCLFASVRWVKKQYIAGKDIISKKS